MGDACKHQNHPESAEVVKQALKILQSAVLSSHDAKVSHYGESGKSGASTDEH